MAKKLSGLSVTVSDEDRAAIVAFSTRIGAKNHKSAFMTAIAVATEVLDRGVAITVSEDE